MKLIFQNAKQSGVINNLFNTRIAGRGLSMGDFYPPLEGRASPEEIFAILQEFRRHQGLVHMDEPFGLNMSIDEWRETDELLPWKGFARSMNAAWGIDIPLKVWRRALEPAKQRTVGDVCRLIATHAPRWEIKPHSVLGRECLAGGAFLTVRSLLAEAGADVSELSPSSELGEYPSRYPQVFVVALSRLAPGRLPTYECQPLYHDVFWVIFLLPFVLFIVTVITGSDSTALWYAMIAFAILAVVVPSLSARYATTVPGRFGELQTFADLCHCLAGNSTALATHLKKWSTSFLQQ